MSCTSRILLVSGLLIAWTAHGIAQSTLPDGAGKQAVQEACSVCHGLNYLVRWKRTLGEWRDVVNNMVALGAPMISTEEIEAAIQYLAKNLGSSTPLSGPHKINVNRASPKELETALGLSTSEAEAIQRYRDANGKIGGWNDLQNVRGVDLKKLESQRFRLTY